MKSANGSSPKASPTPPILSETEFRQLAVFLKQHAGLHIETRKRREIHTRLAPLLEGLSPHKRNQFFSDIYQPNSKTLQPIINRLTIGESYFFRNHPHFEALTDSILPSLINKNQHKKSLNIWSAACSTGEEPYSIAMLIKSKFPEIHDWDIHILATDINTSFLEQAKQGEYTNWSFRGVPDRIKKQFFSFKAPNSYNISPEIINSVNFQQLNLSSLPYTGPIFGTPFDLVICRNVLIYFSFELANNVIDALAKTIAPDGFLIVGHAESFPTLKKLKVIYSNATYYYQHSTTPAHLPPNRPTHTLSIPGIGVSEVDYDDKATVKNANALTENPDAISQSSLVTKQTTKRRTLAKHKPSQNDFDPDQLQIIRDHLDLGELTQAQRLLEEILEGPGKLNYVVHFLFALVSDQNNNTQDAINSIRQSVFLNKKFILGHYYYGTICERDCDYKTALRCYRNTHNLMKKMPDNQIVEESGNTTVLMLRNIVTERIKEISIEIQ